MGVTETMVSGDVDYAGRDTGLSYKEQKALHEDDAKDFKRTRQGWWDNLVDDVIDSWNSLTGDVPDFSDAETARLRGTASGLSSERMDQIADNVRTEAALGLAGDVAGVVSNNPATKLAGKVVDNVAASDYADPAEARFANDLREAVADAQLGGLTSGVVKTGLAMLTGNPVAGQVAVTGYDTVAMNSTINEALSPEAREAAAQAADSPTDRLERGRRERSSGATTGTQLANIVQQQLSQQQTQRYQPAPQRFQQQAVPLYQDPLQGMYSNIYGMGMGAQDMYGVTNPYNISGGLYG